MSAQEGTEAPPAEERRYLARGIWYQRTIGLLLVAVGLGQILLQVAGGNDHALLVIGALQVLCGLVLSVLCWARAAQTRVGSAGLDVREGMGAMRHYAWTVIDHVQPEGHRTPRSELHLTSGRVVQLPGVHGERARHLAGVVARRTAR